MKVSMLFCLLGLSGLAQARPVVVEESAILPDNPAWQYFGQQVAIDGDWALVSGDRYIPDANAENGLRHEGAALLYRKTGSTWSFVRVLGSIEVLDEWTIPGLAMKGRRAMVINKTPHVFELFGSTWSESPITVPAGGIQGPDIEIDSNRILVSRIACAHNSAIFTKQSDNTWVATGLLAGDTFECSDSPPGSSQDIEGSRAVVLNEFNDTGQPAGMHVYRKDASGSGWSPLVNVANQGFASYFGPAFAMHDPHLAIEGTRETGTVIYREANLTWGRAQARLQPIDSYLQPILQSTTQIEHGGEFFFQRNYSFDRGAWVIHVFRVFNDWAVNDRADEVATLVAKDGGTLGNSIDISGNRVIVSDYELTGARKVRVFELPTTFAPLPVETHDFEDASPEAAWQPTAGSAFSVVVSGTSHVYRQSSTAGDAASYLPSTESTDQAIQAQVTPIAFNGADRWVGLATRQTGSNYYYVTLRSSGSVQLKRVVNGTITPLASAPYTVTAGRHYQLRLESIGTTHRVYVDEKPLLTAYDSALTQGRAGVVTYRASADFDNVIVSPDALTSLYREDFADADIGSLGNLASPDQWHVGDGVYHQISTTGDARVAVGTPADDEVVQVRVRPTGFNGPDRFVGVMLRHENDTSFIYLSLRSSNLLSLRQLFANGEISVLSEQPFTVTQGQWYTLRVERVGVNLKVLVDGVVRMSLDTDPGRPRGGVGLLTYKASADFDDFVAYQP